MIVSRPFQIQNTPTSSLKPCRSSFRCACVRRSCRLAFFSAGARLARRFSGVELASPELDGIALLAFPFSCSMESNDADAIPTLQVCLLPKPRGRFRSARQPTIANESVLSAELANWHFAFAVEVRQLDGHRHAAGERNAMGYDASD